MALAVKMAFDRSRMGCNKEETTIDEQTKGVRGDASNNNNNYNGGGGVNRKWQVQLCQLSLQWSCSNGIGVGSGAGGSV